MNKSEQIVEKLQLLESNLFNGYEIENHLLLSPKQKEQILTKENKVYGPRRFRFKDKKRRTVTVYHHQGVHYGKVEHSTQTNHHMDIHFYRLKKRKLIK